MTKGSILAVDLGLKHVGLALARFSHAAQPLQDFLYTDQFQLQKKLGQILDDYQIKIMVVGDMGQRNLAQPLTQSLQKVAKQKKVKLEIVSERLTTFQAEQNQQQYGKSASANLHSHAAFQILQDYLHAQN